MSRVQLLLMLLHCSMAACGGSSETSCTRDEDCAGSFCRADGTCAPADDVDAGTDAPGTGSDGSSGLCNPNHDGKLEANELPLIAGRMATFRVSTNATFDTAGHANGDGSRTWDLSGAQSGDADRTVALQAPAGTWWQPDFPAA